MKLFTRKQEEDSERVLFFSNQEKWLVEDTNVTLVVARGCRNTSVVPS
jgi:hypothetical protein